MQSTEFEGSFAAGERYKGVLQDNIWLIQAKILIVALLAVRLSCAPLFAQGTPQVMKMDAVASSGRCVIPAVSSPASAGEILSLHNISLVGGTSADRVALASGLAQASALAGGTFWPAMNVQISFASRLGYSAYYGVRRGTHLISMNRCNKKGESCRANNVAHLMHEIGHRVGHAAFSGSAQDPDDSRLGGGGRKAEEMYAAYRRLGGKCQVSSYSRKNLYEEFAEVFSAYLTHPELLSGGDAGCQRAFAFFARDVFRANGSLASCTPASRRILLARFTGATPVQVAAASPGPRAVAEPRPNSGPRPTRPGPSSPTWSQPSRVATAQPMYDRPRARPAARRPINDWYFGSADEEEQFQEEARVATASFRGWPW